MHVIDLRSDTVTQPTLAMRQAMAVAEVGDAALGEDPTVNQLEELTAALTGKEAALLMPSGTQGNLVSLLTHCGSRDGVIVGDQAYTHRFEQGGMAAFGGIYPCVVPNRDDGTMDLEVVAGVVGSSNMSFSRVRLLCLENTHNLCHGTPLTPEYTHAAAEVAHRHGVTVHLDGARIFNAAVALGVEVEELVAPVDSVSFCLNKGLSAPIGSLLCGSRSFIEKARRVRMMLGGDMHQAGVIAAAGILALTTMVDRLGEDHANAYRLARGIATISDYDIDLTRVSTNIVYFDIVNGPSADDVAERARDCGVLIWPSGARRLRAMTHNGVTESDIDEALAVLEYLWVRRAIAPCAPKAPRWVAAGRGGEVVGD